MEIDVNWSDKAIVLKVGSFREADLWVSLLTSNHGLISAFAFGGSKSKHRFCGCLDMFNELRIQTKTSRNGRYITLEEGSLLEGSKRLRIDQNRFGMMVNCVRFLETIGISDEKDSYRVVKCLWRYLEISNQVLENLPILFRLRLASDLGYAPDFSMCAACGKTNLDRVDFFMAEGMPLCEQCAIKRGGSGISLMAKELDILHRVQHQMPDEWDFGNENAKECRTCARIIDDFIQYHLGINYPPLRDGF